MESVRQRVQIGPIFGGTPALLRLRELETRIYIGFAKHVRPDTDGVDQESI